MFVLLHIWIVSGGRRPACRLGAPHERSGLGRPSAAASSLAGGWTQVLLTLTDPRRQEGGEGGMWRWELPRKHSTAPVGQSRRRRLPRGCGEICSDCGTRGHAETLPPFHCAPTANGSVGQPDRRSLACHRAPGGGRKDPPPERHEWWWRTATSWHAAWPRQLDHETDTPCVAHPGGCYV